MNKEVIAMSKERCCGTCEHSQYGEDGYMCICAYDDYEGDHYSDYVEHDFVCEDYKKEE